MSEERRTILDMLSQGKIRPEEAERLLDAISSRGTPVQDVPPNEEKDLPKYLFVRVEPKQASPDADQVKVTVPLGLLKAGINFMNLLPKEARKDVESAIEQSGMNFDFEKLAGPEADALLLALKELEVDIETKDNRVKVYTG